LISNESTGFHVPSSSAFQGFSENLVEGVLHQTIGCGLFLSLAMTADPADVRRKNSRNDKSLRECFLTASSFPWTVPTAGFGKS
jgi:hypothetical protein